MTNSLSFPNMFDTARNKVSVISDSESLVNRVRLLMLTSPTELYNSPDFGVGLQKYLWQYNTENQKSIIKDRIKAQLDAYEPCCIAAETQFADGLLFTESDAMTQDYNTLKFTVALKSNFGDTVEIDLSDLQAVIDEADRKYE